MKKNILVFLFLLSGIAVYPQINPQLLSNQVYKPQLSTVRLLGVTRPLRFTQALLPNRSGEKTQKLKEIFNEHESNRTLNQHALPVGMDPVRQLGRSPQTVDIDTLLSFEGMANPNVYPPDPCGEIGRNEYIQMVNSSNGATFQIYDKSGSTLYGPATCNTLWTQFGTTGLGDPIVMYDQQADRWMLSELSNSFSDVLLAISQTADPLGSYYVYDFQTPGLPDYPKYFIWNDGYYFCSNEGSGGSPIYALNRNALLTGVQSTNLLRWTIPGFSAIGFQLASGADWDGSTPPPIGSPAYILRTYDDAWGGGVDHLEVWELAVNWTSPGSSTLTGPTDLAVSPFDSELCPGFGYCVPQPAGGNLDVLQQIIMHRVLYRNFGSYESMVLNHVVDVDGTGATAGVRWYELRKTSGGSWTVFQEGTFAPDGDSRFMGSIAQDGAGNIALGYSISSTTHTPSLRIVGRNSGDAPGQMTYSEMEFATGLTSFQNGRWGDYSEMSVDPTDDHTFWYTGEYMQQNDWSTRIVKFSLRKDTNDLAVTALLSPVTGGGLTATEIVTARIRNSGINPQSNFLISYSLDGAAPVTETISTLLLPDSSYDYSFLVPADLSVANQSYSFKIYTSLSTDANLVNDTLVANVAHLVDLDARAFAIAGISGVACGTTRDVQFVFKNEGAAVLNSLNANYIINGGTVNTVAYTGSLLPGQQDTIFLTLNGLVNGPNTVTFYSSQPNGLPDQNPSNDSITESFPMIYPGIGITVELKTDNYPEETSWEIHDAGGTLLYSGTGYTQQQSVYQESVCLEDTCYTLILLDSYGDGFDIGGNGYIKVIRNDGVILATNTVANFGYSETHQFCTDFLCTVSGTAAIVDASSASSADGSILVSVSGGSAPYEYSFNGGLFQSANFFQNLLPGNYSILIRDVNHCQDTLLVTVGIQIGIAELWSQGIEVLLQPNPVNNVLTLTVKGMLSASSLELEIVDATGRVVKHGKLVNYDSSMVGTVVFGDHPAGIYFVRFKDNRFTHLYRFIKS